MLHIIQLFLLLSPSMYIIPYWFFQVTVINLPIFFQIFIGKPIIFFSLLLSFFSHLFLTVPVKESRPYNDNLWTHFFLKVDSPFPKSRLSFPWKCTFYENQRYYHSFFFFSCLLRTNLGSSDKSRFEKVSLCSNSSFWYFS